MTTPQLMPQLWPIFICYRRIDGTAVARRLHRMLDKWQSTGPEGQPVQLDVYLDETMPGVQDWQALHRPYLEKARAIIVICTPGAKLNEGPQDWVHKEIDWWLEHRETAPILIDSLGEGARYVPSQIAHQWPDIQRIELIEEEWRELPEAAIEEKTAAIRHQILGAILPSAASVYAQELAAERQRARGLQRALVASVMLLTVALLAAGYAFDRRRAARDSEQVAAASLLDAQASDFFARSRLIVLRRDVASLRREDLVRRLDSLQAPDPLLDTRRSNLRHELAQLDQDLRQLKAESVEALNQGRELLRQANVAWAASGTALARRRGKPPEPPHIFSVELLNAGSGESVLLHYGTPDKIRLVMINTGPRRTYEQFIERRLRQISTLRFDGAPVPIELFVVGDQDEDKTGGLLSLLEHLVENRSPQKRLVEIRQIWANIFRVDGGQESFRPHLRRLIDELGLPLNQPFDQSVICPEQGRAAVTLPGGLEIIVLGPDRQRLTAVYKFSANRDAERGGTIEPLRTESHSRFDLAAAPVPSPVATPGSKLPGDCTPSKNARRRAEGRYVDRSVFNLASMVLLFRYQDKTFLFTGDARGDKVLEGLETAGLMNADGPTRVDLLTLPHAGSNLSVDKEFFQWVQASDYTFSGGNPDVPTVAAVVAARGCDAYRMYFVNRGGETDEHGRNLDAFFQAERIYNPNYRRIFRSPEQGSVVVDLLDPLRN